MALTLPPLPYAEDALAPHISARTVHYHYHKHHAGYVNKVNELVNERGIEPAPLDALIRDARERDDQALFNSAAQAWNHTFFWQSLSPAPAAPSADFERRIRRDFGSLDELRSALADAALAQFGSGWAWLVLDGDTLKVTSTGNAESPLTGSQLPLLTLDVWEHAYYLDYQHERDRFVNALLDHLVDWSVAEARLAAGERRA